MTDETTRDFFLRFLFFFTSNNKEEPGKKNLDGCCCCSAIDTPIGDDMSSKRAREREDEPTDNRPSWTLEKTLLLLLLLLLRLGD